MRPIEYIRRRVTEILDYDLPDEVFRPALSQAMDKALLVRPVEDKQIVLDLDWLAMVTCEVVNAWRWTEHIKSRMERRV